jgi:cytochrome c nitrite reductase small subunit
MSGFIALLLKLLPPPKWRVPVIIALGLSAGIGGVIFWQSRAWSYLLDDPSACINCHIMIPQYTTWQHSSHARVATCNDCHVPHDNIFNKYFFKAKDGTRHSFLFTMRMEDQVIRITEPSMRVVQMNCVRCHEHVNDKVHTKVTMKQIQHGEGKLCWECHREVPHGRVNSLSSVPNAKIQLETSKLPAWLRSNPKGESHVHEKSNSK